MSESQLFAPLRLPTRETVAGRHSITVPAIFAWADPDSVSAEQRRALPPGSRCDRVTSTLDVSATMLDALGAPPLPSSAVSRTNDCRHNLRSVFQRSQRQSCGQGRSLMPVIHADGKDAEWDDVACECSNGR